MTKIKGLSIALVGILFAMIGVISGFGGFYLELRWLSMAGFAITTFGVGIGFIGVIYGWVVEGKRAITGRREGTEALRKKINHFWK
jgi:hypothetical protein